MAYRITQIADEDLVSIAGFSLQKWGEAQTRAYIEELFSLFEDIAKKPLASAKADYIQPGLRKQLHPKRQHVIYFRLGGDGTVEILRILHAHQNHENRFEE